MEGPDWAAWIAVKMVVQATLRTRSADFDQQRKFILGEGSFDGNKGLAVSVRPWDHQLRQAVLLAAPYTVVASAPVEGFLHKTNDLDTLGDDEPETPCGLTDRMCRVGKASRSRNTVPGKRLCPRGLAHDQGLG